MATQQHQRTISLKIMVDKAKNRVVFAETDMDFVDVLFSFLTLPLGTIIRLVSNQSPPNMIGCLNSLYESVSNLDSRYMQTDACKVMLLRPQNTAEKECRNLKLNIDDTEPSKYFICTESCSETYYGTLTATIRNTRCRCGKLMSKERGDIISSNEVNMGESVFLEGFVKFMIIDDLQVMPMSTAASFSLLNHTGVRDRNAIEERTVNVGLEEVLKLLKCSFLSKAPLTDVFLKKLNSSSSEMEFESVTSLRTQNESETAAITGSVKNSKITIDLISRKSNKNVLYAEVGEDFINFIFSFLTFPMGSAEQVLGARSQLGCIDNLYKSISGTTLERYMRSEDMKAKLLCPKIAQNFGCDNQLLDIKEEYKDYLVNPKYPNYETRNGGGFVKGRTTFMVTDNLVVTPLISYTSSVALLDRLKVEAHDLEQRTVCVGKKEAVNLLKASLITKSALTYTFNLELSLKKAKQEN